MQIGGKRCLVTGAASGIGRSTAVATAKRGGSVVLADIDAVGLRGTADAIRAAGGTVLHAAPLDVTDDDAVRAFADAVHAEHGSLDVVMNVAGVSTWGSVQALRASDWDQMIDVNLRGPIHVISAFVPPMIDAGRGGHLVNVSSAAGLFGLPWHAAYSASKFGLRGVSEVLRFDLERHRIGVTLVCPGAVDTPLVQSVNIVGLDRDHPSVRKLTERFQKHAASADEVAERILRGIERERYLVYTSADTRALHLLERVAPPVYMLVMRRLQKVLGSVARKAGAQP